MRLAIRLVAPWPLGSRRATWTCCCPDLSRATARAIELICLGDLCMRLDSPGENASCKLRSICSAYDIRRASIMYSKWVNGNTRCFRTIGAARDDRSHWRRTKKNDDCFERWDIPKWFLGVIYERLYGENVGSFGLTKVHIATFALYLCLCPRDDRRCGLLGACQCSANFWPYFWRNNRKKERVKLKRNRMERTRRKLFCIQSSFRHFKSLHYIEFDTLSNSEE